MKHLLVEKFTDLIATLERFFKANYNRFSTPESIAGEDKDIFNLACKIYKRGFLTLPELTLSTPVDDRIEKMQLLTEFPPPLGSDLMEKSRKAFFLVDENFIKYHPIIENFYAFLPSETKKNLSTVKNILTVIPEQTDSIFVIGGGITLDIGGFIAGILNLPVHYLPTTLLSAVDAAIGGKTGVNFPPYGKNQIGLFYKSSSLYFTPKFLQTLSQEEKLCGVIEAAKHAYLFGQFETDVLILKKIISHKISNEELAYLVNKNFYYKSKIVNLDPLEQNGIRGNLNFGHTLAHVLEFLAEEKYINKISHGIAVGHGIKFLFDFNFIPEKNNFLEFINEVLIHYSIQLKKEIKLEKIINLLLQDKKNTNKEQCSLSLPAYGCYKDSAIKEFFAIKIGQDMLNYINASLNKC